MPAASTFVERLNLPDRLGGALAGGVVTVSRLLGYTRTLTRAADPSPPNVGRFAQPGLWKERFAMAEQNTVYKMLELTGTSNKSIEDAVQTAVARASKTVRNLRWFEVTETRGAIEKGKVTQWQVMLKVGFKLDD